MVNVCVIRRLGLFNWACRTALWDCLHFKNALRSTFKFGQTEVFY